jgi:hypothetical protein
MLHHFTGTYLFGGIDHCSSDDGGGSGTRQRKKSGEEHKRKHCPKNEDVLWDGNGEKG